MIKGMFHDNDCTALDTIVVKTIKLNSFTMKFQFRFLKEATKDFQQLNAVTFSSEFSAICFKQWNGSQ